jgi:hypothetical protein
MPITFGSVGDIISVCLIVKDLVDALDKSRGAAAEYQDIIRELWILDRALIQVSKLSNPSGGSIELHAVCATLRQAVDNCRLSLDSFLQEMYKYVRCLGARGSGNAILDTTRRLQWKLTRKDRLAKFKVEVAGRFTAVNMLVNTAQV